MKNSSKQNTFFCILMMVFIVIFDQATKYSILAFLPKDSITSIFPFLNLVLVFNYGTSFGLLSPSSINEHYIMIFITIFCILLLFYFFIKTKNTSEKFLTSLLIGGALGNLLDRFLHGAVIDFLDIYYKNWHWPAFNAADSFICVSAILLLLFSLTNKKQA